MAERLDGVRDRVQVLHYSIRTEDASVRWVERLILFHRKRHPQEMGAREREASLTHLAADRSVAASTQNQALSAVLFLGREVLGRPIGEFGPDGPGLVARAVAGRPLPRRGPFGGKTKGSRVDSRRITSPDEPMHPTELDSLLFGVQRHPSRRVN